MDFPFQPKIKNKFEEPIIKKEETDQEDASENIPDVKKIERRMEMKILWSAKLKVIYLSQWTIREFYQKELIMRLKKNQMGIKKANM